LSSDSVSLFFPGHEDSRERGSKAHEPLIEVPTRNSERRTELLDVAVRIFHEKGYAETTLQDIADAMGFTKPAVYYYAKNKEQLLLEIYARVVVPATERARVIAAEPGTGAERFVALIRQHLTTFLDNIEANAVFEVNSRSLSGQGSTQVHDWGRAYGGVVARVYREGIEDGSLRVQDPFIVVNAVLGMCNAVHRWYPGSGRSASETIDEVVSLITHGLLSPDSV
jgi:AcrR family transcriptional regulator